MLGSVITVFYVTKEGKARRQPSIFSEFGTAMPANASCCQPTKCRIQNVRKDPVLVTWLRDGVFATGKSKVKISPGQTLKLSPHPQAPFAFGFSNTNSALTASSCGKELHP
jgi:hypothetical protein